MDTGERLELFRQLTGCIHKLYYWRYTAPDAAPETDSQYAEVLNSVFRSTGALEVAFSGEACKPYVFSNSGGLMWAAACERTADGAPVLHVLGPCFVNAVPSSYIDRLVHKYSNATPSWRRQLMEAVKALPVLPSSTLCSWAAMLCCCVSGRQVHTSDIQYYPKPDTGAGAENVRRSRVHIYQAERMLLHMVREGDLNSEFARTNATSTARIQDYVSDPLINVKVACIILVTLCTRAAIEGGLSPDESYSIGDVYIRNILEAKSPSEAAFFKAQMYTDYITRVHACRSNPDFSKVIQSCCDYIELHAEDDLNIDIIADRMGYTKYYLSRRFKKETGCSINDYIKIVKVERAKLLLANTRDSISDITERLNFCSRSYFTDTFKSITGKSPAQYRTEQQSF